MKSLLLTFRDASIGTRLASLTFLVVATVFSVFALSISYSSSKLLEKRALTDLTAEAKVVVDMIEIFNSDLKRETGRFARVLGGYFPGEFGIDPGSNIEVAGVPTPALTSGGKVLNLDFSIPDRFTGLTGVTATIFARRGDDFVRVSTSVKKEDGSRAVGTTLDRAHPGYPLLLSGTSYNGVVTLFGKQYFTQYDPIRDAKGKVIGALYVGIDFTENLNVLKSRIKSLQVGDTGYFYAIDGKPGKNFGRLLLHPSREGETVLDEKAADGRMIMRDILEMKDQTLRYAEWSGTPGASDPRERLAVVKRFDEWGWVLVASTFADEITREATELRNLYNGIGGTAVLLLAGALYLTIRRTVVRPLKEATHAAQLLAKGDLTVRLNTTRTDEIGLLMNAMNGISQGLSNVVAEVRRGTEQVTTASQEIAAGNADLSSRTEAQAGSLEETAASMEELTATVKQNVDGAMQANRLAAEAADAASRGGAVVSEVVGRMGAIRDSSRRITEIIGVIDGIAFQTNILALNAAVEAARAGEQGRGFAVVAGEVRGLAQRCAGAAREIKALIGESVTEVEAGGRLVDEAGATMKEVVRSIRGVAQIMSEISTASEEQSSGIEQVNQAITHMDKVTQQNAALVEEAAAAAASLEEQASTLLDVVSVFRIEEASHAPQMQVSATVMPLPVRHSAQRQGAAAGHRARGLAYAKTGS